MIKEVPFSEKEKFNHLATHPLQSWEWGEFRKKLGLKVLRLGRYEKGILQETVQLTLHPLPFSPFGVGYLPKTGILSQEMGEKLQEVGRKNRCLFFKLEPNIQKNNFPLANKNNFLLLPSPHPLFPKFTFQLDLGKSEEEILKGMHPKTRYNIKVAQRHRVLVKEDNSPQAFQNYLRLLNETTKRQRYYAHNERYHQLMWETLYPGKIAHLFTATYQNQVLVAWILFLFKNVLYYPYGASSSSFRYTMASNLMMWEAIRFGKRMKAKVFDLWGALGPKPDKKDPWYGFHRFKEGYGGKLVEFAGSFDLVISPVGYRWFNFLFSLRKIFLKIKSYL